MPIPRSLASWRRSLQSRLSGAGPGGGTNSLPPTMPRRSQGGAALPRIASRFLNTPVCFERARLEALLASLQHPVDPKAFGLWFEASGPSAPEYQRVERVAVVPVHGPLANRHDEYAWWMGWSSYEGIKAAIAGALEDPAIESILLDVDSPGGEMCGLLDLVDWIRAQRDAGAKPITNTQAPPGAPTLATEARLRALNVIRLLAVQSPVMLSSVQPRLPGLLQPPRS